MLISYYSTDSFLICIGTYIENIKKSANSDIQNHT